jgi:hypothetical protein
MKLRFLAAGGSLILFSLSGAIPAWAALRHPNVRSLSRNSQEIFATSMQWADRSWDPHVELCRAPAGTVEGDLRASSYYMVRESTWYALGLLLRDGPGDRQRAIEILRVVLKQQYHEPGKPWNGTFKRSPNEPEPPANAEMWRGYDPNWREFIGTAFAIILEEYRNRIPDNLAEEMMTSIDDAVSGEVKQGRLQPTYSNPALMLAFLWDYAAAHGNRPQWVAAANKWQDTVYGLFKQHDTFDEFNSPTYGGVDLYALALWRDYGSTQQMRARGREMEAALWRTTAKLYNANLRNISGPYDRSYGMDMRSYVSVTGLWLRTVLNAEQAPLPSFKPPVDHVADLWFVPLIVVLDTHIPPDTMKSFVSFQGQHEVRQPIAEGRIATAWIGKDVIYGGEFTGHTRGVDAKSQFHPVTVQWQAPGKIGWIQLTRCPPIDATADQRGIDISADGDVSFRINAPGIMADKVKADKWELSGLIVKIKADQKSFTAQQNGAFLDISYKAVTNMHLTIMRPTE